VGPLFHGGLCLERLKLLQQLDHEVIPLDTHRLLNRWSGRYLCHRVSLLLDYPLDVLGVNQQLLQLAVSHAVDLVWIDKGLIIYPWTIKRLRKLHPHLAVIDLNPDNPFVSRTKGWGWYKKCTPLYDFCFVPREVSVRDYL
jgi:hypothetical protein